jgi:hypothetical protein
VKGDPKWFVDIGIDLKLFEIFNSLPRGLYLIKVCFSERIETKKERYLDGDCAHSSNHVQLFFFFFFESEFVFRGMFNGVQRWLRRLLRVMLGCFTSGNRGQRKLATCSEIRICCMVVVCKWQQGRLRRRKKESSVPHPSSHSARGLLQALVSSRNQSSDWTHSGVSSSCGKLQGRPLTVKCLRHAAVNRGQEKSTCSMVWRASPHWQAICSWVCCVKKCRMYSAQALRPRPETRYHNKLLYVRDRVVSSTTESEVLNPAAKGWFPNSGAIPP